MVGHIAGEQTVHFETIEVTVRSSALSIAGRVLEAALNGDTRDYRGPAASYSCGAVARYAGRRAETIVTVLGPLKLNRTYYHCAECGHGFFPRDQALHIRSGSLSEGMLRMVGTTASLVSFADAIHAVFPLTEVQVCIVHVVRSCLKFVSYKERQAVATGMKRIYTAATEEAALGELEEFSAEWDERYPMIGRSWRNRWTEISPFFAYSPE